MKEYLKKYLPSKELEQGLNLLKQGIPAQYIIGNVNFYGNILKVNKNVLIPRFETEELVSYTIPKIKDGIDILDIGTGSGAIAITLKKFFPHSNIIATDISKKALSVAKENAKLNKTNINFIYSDIFSNVKGQFDLIISNPPYIKNRQLVEDIVYNNEPHIALFAQNEGLEFYEKILSNIKPFLKNNSLIAFEIGFEQKNKIRKIVKKYLPNYKIQSIKDMQKKDRFIFISKT